MSKGRRSYRHLSEKWVAILRKDPCSFCGVRASITIDHIFPLSKFNELKTYSTFGPNNWENLTGVCWDCNEFKGTTKLLRFLVEAHENLLH